MMSTPENNTPHAAAADAVADADAVAVTKVVAANVVVVAVVDAAADAVAVVDAAAVVAAAAAIEDSVTKVVAAATADAAAVVEVDVVAAVVDAIVTTAAADAADVVDVAVVTADAAADVNVAVVTAAADATCFHNGDKLVINPDPFATIAINNLHRRHDVTDGNGSDLWSLDQWAGTFPHERLDNRYPILSPIKFKSTLGDDSCGVEWSLATRVTQLEYASRFSMKFNLVSVILPIENVVVAGGSAAYPIGDLEIDIGDVDLFIHGIDPADNSTLWAKVLEISDRLKASAANLDDTLIIKATLYPGVVTFDVGHTSRGNMLVVQVILRAYPSISAILHGFDIPSCCVAFDGRMTYLTSLSAWAHAYRINPIIPAYRSTTFEARLVKYHRRGYAIMMPNLNKKSFATNRLVILPHMAICPVVDHKYYMGGYILARGCERTSSDYYTTIPVNIDIDTINSREFVQESFQFKMTEIYSCRDASSPWSSFRTLKEAAVTINDMLTRKSILSYLNSQGCRVVTASNDVNIKLLTDTFGLNLEEIKKLSTIVALVGIKNPHRQPDVRPALATFCKKILVRFALERQKPINWWITVDPTRQYTCSLNPRLEHPSEWYGGFYVSETSQVSTSPLPLVDELSEQFSRSTCGICLAVIEPEGANIVKLSCGHEFHRKPDFGSTCRGIHEWADTLDSCPTCQAPFTVVELLPIPHSTVVLHQMRCALEERTKIAINIKW